jgi:hypothetical protein
MDDIEDVENNGTAEVIAALQNTIAVRIEETLDELRDSLGAWEKAHIANAIAALSWSTRQKPPTTAWLRLSAVNLENARIPPEERDEHFAPIEEHLARLTYEQLCEALAAARGGL